MNHAEQQEQNHQSTNFRVQRVQTLLATVQPKRSPGNRKVVKGGLRARNRTKGEARMAGQTPVLLTILVITFYLTLFSNNVCPARRQPFFYLSRLAVLLASLASPVFYLLYLYYINKLNHL